MHEEWSNFKKKFRKNYSSLEEEFKRKLIFAENLKNIREHNSNPNAEFQLGINPYTDLSHEEYVKMLGFRRPNEPHRK